MRLLVLLGIILGLLGCNSKPSGFGIPESPIRFQTKKFEDPAVIAEVGENKFFRKSILEKSQVLKDLVLQENEALVGLAYLKAVSELLPSNPNQNRIRIDVPVANPKIEQILSRFGKEPNNKLMVDFRGEQNPDEFLSEPFPSQIIATFGTTEITRGSLNLDHFVFQSIEQRRFREVALQLNSQVSRILISMEAQKSKMGLSDFLKKNVFNGDIVVTDEDLNRHFSKIGFSREELTPQLEQRFKDSLKQKKEQEGIENFVASKVLKGPLQVAFSEPKSEFKVSKDFDTSIGYDGAPVAVVVFASATCNDCKSAIQNLYEVASEFDGYLKINWIHQTSMQEGFSDLFAEATLCVDSQKSGKALKFLSDLAGPPSEFSEDKFYSWAKNNRVDSEELKECIIKGESKKLLSDHNSYVSSVGIISNPTVWIDGIVLEGNITKDALRSSIASKIVESGASKIGAIVRKWKSRLGL